MITALECFPFPPEEARGVQVRALEHFVSSVELGYRDIVLQAPTGAGKSAMLLALCQWANSITKEDAARLGLKGVYGGYYLTAQKLLQDQIENDIPRYRRPYERVASLKSAVSYSCVKQKRGPDGVTRHLTCAEGLAGDEDARCKNDDCPYRLAKMAFLSSPAALTNYAYFFTERHYAGKFPARRLLAIDECHRLESEVLKFVDIRVSKSWIEKYAPSLETLPIYEHLLDFVDWLESTYMPAVEDKFNFLVAMAQDSNSTDDFSDDINALENHINKVKRAVKMVRERPRDWVYWREKSESNGEETVIARPLDASPFFDQLVRKTADIRVYASAFPGTKKVYCRSLGLDPDRVVWMSLKSDFNPKHRPVVMCTVGSMGRSSIDKTLPAVVRMAVTLARKHANSKGLVHAHSYALSNALYAALSAEFPGRCLYPRNAAERDALFAQHVETDDPTILISPSMAEGFDFKDDLARWQIIAKCAWPSLSDKRTAVMLERDPEWYRCEAFKSFLQACGRVCRSATDHGVTYVLDKDVERLLNDVDYMVPKWFSESIVHLK
jgi:Rad3-related DNA helicase